jgi:hypothetical protein
MVMVVLLLRQRPSPAQKAGIAEVATLTEAGTASLMLNGLDLR